MKYNVMRGYRNQERLFRYSILFVFLVSLIVITSSSINFQYIFKRDITAQNLNIREYVGLKQKDFSNYSGNGVTIAIIDSGINKHNDLDKSNIIYFKDFVNNKNNIYDDFGHGTFISGIIAADGRIRGVAPKCNLIVLKVLDKYGKCDIKTFETSIKWVVDNMEKYNINIVNISIGIPISINETDKDTVYSYLKLLKGKGVITICSAGNDGPNSGTILYPGMSKDVITVGYINSKGTYSLSDDKVAISSSRGTENCSFIKPDILTLGIDINSLDYKTNDGYVINSGSSYAAAIISGVTAILLEKFKGKPISYIDEYIKSSTYRLNDIEKSSQGNGEFKLKSLE